MRLTEPSSINTDTYSPPKRIKIELRHGQTYRIATANTVRLISAPINYCSEQRLGQRDKGIGKFFARTALRVMDTWDDFKFTIRSLATDSVGGLVKS